MAAVTLCSDHGAQESQICHCHLNCSTAAKTLLAAQVESQAFGFHPSEDGPLSTKLNGAGVQCPTLRDPMDQSTPGPPAFHICYNQCFSASTKRALAIDCTHTPMDMNISFQPCALWAKARGFSHYSVGPTEGSAKAIQWYLDLRT